MISGEKAGSHSIQGLGAGFVPKVLNTQLIDEIIKIAKRKELINKRLIVILPSFGERYLSTAMFESNTSIQARKDGYL